ncbi:transporter substrate-binding domain-containing protein [Pseudomonas sp. RP23018S]|uniref:substrate-binding periplasmic protein n=1 Tax=Pseudomonas sp. RP23018S TaxID=3096037 RepID=UPI002ACAF790|nr:transporter substrate-binding domain-containing protein [Pseudomonas sp. RP23018S]MDZ5602665.1 transporter substrate-binding domain-containing protein [Pseudomonas sp. RP23018S]
MLKRCACLLLCSLLGVSLGQAHEDCTQLTVTGNPEYPPYLWRDPDDPSRLIGANADLIDYVATQLGLRVQVRYTGPWPRAQEEVRLGRVDGMAGYFRTEHREQTTDFISPAFTTTRSVVWVRQEASFTYTSWADLKGHKGGTLVNNSYGQGFDDYAEANLDLEAVPTASQAFEKLLHKRTDYLIYERYPGAAMAQSLGIDAALRVLDPPISSEGLYLALSKASPCNTAALRERLAHLMKALVSSDMAEQWVTRNLARWKRQQQRSH